MLQNLLGVGIPKTTILEAIVAATIATTVVTIIIIII